jgi:hypothetical protein
MGTETFDASPYDQIKILTDFDPSLKFVTIDVETELTTHSNDEPSTSSTDNNSFTILMTSQTLKRKPPKLLHENFTGICLNKILF